MVSVIEVAYDMVQLWSVWLVGKQNFDFRLLLILFRDDGHKQWFYFLFKPFSTRFFMSEITAQPQNIIVRCCRWRLQGDSTKRIGGRKPQVQPPKKAEHPVMVVLLFFYTRQRLEF